jgi:subtilisin-like proprotein convertase family protein
MDARNAAQLIGAILIIVAGACGGAVYASSLYSYTDDFNLPIPAMDDPQREHGKGMGRMDDAVIEIPHSFIISDLDVRINITHTNVFDLQLFLQSPASTRICLNMYNPFDEFFVGANYTNTIFDDEALLSIKEAEAPFTGRFIPIDVDPYNKLSKFDDENAHGSWHLQIYDWWPTDTGTFNRFELMITTPAPEPATAMLLTFGAGLIRLFKHPTQKLQK